MNRVEVTLQDIFWALKKYIVWIVLACVVGAVGTYAYTELFVTPIYSAKVSMVVKAAQRETEDVTSYDQSADISLSNTYTALMSSQPVCEAVSKFLGGKLSASAISSMISATRVPSTQVINVELRSTDPQLAVEVGNAILEVAPSVLTEKAGGEMVRVDDAQSAALVSPNVQSNVAYGFIVALVLACAVVILIAVLDTTIWREEDLERAYKIPVLGSVPSMTLAAGLSDKSRKGR